MTQLAPPTFTFVAPRRFSISCKQCFYRSSSLYNLLMLTGTVKFFDDSKGFGFIVIEDTQEEIFVHQTGLIHEIQEGDRVQFNIKAGKKGPNAVDVTRLQ